MPAQLIPGTDRKQHATSIQTTMQSPVFFESLHRGDLGPVLAAAQQIDQAIVGHRVAGLDHDQLGIDAAPHQAFDEHHRIAAVSVDAEQRLIDDDDLVGHFSSTPPM